MGRIRLGCGALRPPRACNCSHPDGAFGRHHALAGFTTRSHGSARQCQRALRSAEVTSPSRRDVVEIDRFPDSLDRSVSFQPPERAVLPVVHIQLVKADSDVSASRLGRGDVPVTWKTGSIQKSRAEIRNRELANALFVEALAKAVEVLPPIQIRLAQDLLWMCAGGFIEVRQIIRMSSR